MAGRKLLGWSLAILALPLLYLLFVAAMRLLPPSPAEQAALARLEAPTPPVAGRDGSDAAWLLDYDVPPGRQAAVARQVRDYLGKRDARDAGAGAPARNPLRDWPKFPAVPRGGDGLCSENQVACLDYVRAHRREVKAVLDAQQRRLDAALAFAFHDGMRYGLRPTLTQAFPSFGGQRRLLNTWFAYEFVSSRPQEAIQGLCLDIAGWRRLGGNTDYLIGSMVGVANVRQGLVLLSDMLAEFPIASELPFSCEVALGASADYELDLCPAMRNEFLVMDDIEAQMDAGATGAARRIPAALLIDGGHFRALLAPSRAAYCAPGALQSARADRSIAELLPPAPKCSALRRAADPVGCLFAEAAEASDYSRYSDRRTDQAAMLALMRTVVWLRTAAETQDDVAAALAQRPAILRLRRDPYFDGERGRVSIPMLDPSRGERFELAVRLVTPKPRSRPAFRARGSAFAAP